MRITIKHVDGTLRELEAVAVTIEFEGDITFAEQKPHDTYHDSARQSQRDFERRRLDVRTSVDGEGHS